MHNLSTVVWFEVLRTIKKKSFWLMAILFPVLLGAVFAVIYLSNKATDSAQENLQKEQFSILVTDESKLVDPKLISQLKATTTDNKQTGIQQVKSGTVDAYFYYPADITTATIEIYAQDVGVFNNDRYQAIASSLLRQSVSETIPATVEKVVTGSTTSKVTTYRDGKEYNSLAQMIWPGLFLVLFYILVAFFGNQMLTSTTEEKENRVIEMLLTTVRARTLIIGKIISLISIILIQVVIIASIVLIGFLLVKDFVTLPNIDLNSIPVDAGRIMLGAFIFIISFTFITGLLVAIGSSMPTAKEAGGFLGVVLTMIFAPLYAASLFVSSPDAGIVKFLTLLPFTSPVPLLLRNAVGNLEPWEIIAGCSILTVSAAISIVVAVRAFKFGALVYSRKLSIKEIFSR